MAVDDLDAEDFYESEREDLEKKNPKISEIERALKETLSLIEASRVRVRFIPREKTCKNALKMLLKEKWFTFPRTVSEVYQELRRRGYNYGKSRISHSLLDLVKEGYLYRIGYPKKYKYVMKNQL